MKCVIRAARQVCFHLEILAAIVLPHIDVISKRSIAYDASAAPIIQNLGWSTISNLVRKETATLTYKSLNSLAPDYLRKLFAKCSDNRERFLRSSETDLKIPLPKTINGQEAFSYRGAKLWHCLERATKLAPSLKIFKDHL